MTTTTRERLKKFEDDREYHLFSLDFEAYLQFIETIEKEARQDGREEMRKECLACIPENKDLWWTFTTITHNLLATLIRDSISSL